MKHLLTALIAALFLVLPLHADEPTQTISVRVIDQEGEPISGLALSLQVGSSTHYGVTDGDGLSTPEIPMYTEKGPIYVRPQHSNQILLGHSQGTVTPMHPTSVGWSAELFDRHCQVLNTYPFDRVTRFDVADLIDGVITLQAKEAVRCLIEVKINHQMAGWYLQRRNGPLTHWVSSDSHIVGEDEERSRWGIRRSSLMIPREHHSQIGFYHLGTLSFIEVDPETSDLDSTAVELKIAARVEGAATIGFVSGENDAAWGFFLVISDGAFGRLLGGTSLFPPAALDDQQEQQPHYTLIPAGEYLLVSAKSEDRFGVNFWSPGSVFDTMLRLRRGEDLPHLKRITIPEGGTVELSSEDFLDPPAETETPAEADPR